MAKSGTNPKVEAFLGRAKKWQAELKKLRAIALDCGLNEELKWGKPCYTLEGANISVLQPFKEYCAIMFFQGALLKDKKGLLARPGTLQAGRQMRFTSLEEIVEKEPVLKAYLREAIAAEKAGLKVKLKKPEEFPLPEELKSKFAKTPALKKAFEALTPGRQRGYSLFFSAAKQSATREARIEKCVPQILAGKGLND